jgi:phage FluMu protein Com
MEKVYVDHTNHVKITCPKCGLEKKINVFKFKDTHKGLKANCKCGEVFRFSLDFRKYFRKNVRLAGEYFVQEKDEKGEILIEDISMAGINFETIKPHNFYKNDTVELKFTLDNPMKTEVQKLAKIIWITNHTVGARFNDPKSLDRDFGFYLKG